MTKPIQLTNKNWEKLREKLKEDYPLSTVIIRSKMKSKLGFTVREHRTNLFSNSIMLDFYCEKKRTLFIIKYSEYIEKS